MLMANDVPEIMGKTNKMRTEVKFHKCRKQRRTDKLFNGLSAGGQIEMPMAIVPGGHTFLVFRDKYGIEWMVDFAQIIKRTNLTEENNERLMNSQRNNLTYNTTSE